MKVWIISFLIKISVASLIMFVIPSAKENLKPHLSDSSTGRLKNYIFIFVTVLLLPFPVFFTSLHASR